METSKKKIDILEHIIAAVAGAYYNINRTVLSFDSCKVSEVQPLNSFSCVLSRLGNVIAIGLCHNFHILQCSDLVSDLFS